MLLSEYDPWTFGPESRPITKEDIKAAFEIMKEVTGEFSFWNRAEKLATLNVWIPGLGITISEVLAGKCLTEMGKAYANLPTDQRRVIAKCAKWLHGIVDQNFSFDNFSI